VNAVQHILILGVRLYRWVISPAKTVLFGPLGRCRFTPSCSAYALDAIQRHGALAGSRLAVKRVCRCHPWGGCGDDPVPPNLNLNLKRGWDWERTIKIKIKSLSGFRPAAASSHPPSLPTAPARRSH
jgi:putative membrane protein insertion efficiency factor